LLFILNLNFNYRKVNDGNFGWRALRLLARKSPHFFAQSNNPIHKLSEYLENMIKKTMNKEKIVSVILKIKNSIKSITFLYFNYEFKIISYFNLLNSE
jgi:hypothetical protein